MSELALKYYGTRGSLPSPGKDTSLFGGNTSCSILTYKSEGEKISHKIIIDAGSGIRQLGLDLMQTEFGKGKGRLYLIITHTHWDHIQGFPFFIPAFIPGNEINIYGHASGGASLSKVLKEQQNFQNFPVTLDSMAASITIHDKMPKSLEIDDLKIKNILQSHPGGSLGLRFETTAKSLTFCTDVEHLADMPEKLISFAAGSDLFAYDSQYFPKQYESKKGYGHSTYEVAVRIAKEAGVKKLHLIHHDPTHNDENILEMENKVKKIFPNSIAAKEGQTYNV